MIYVEVVESDDSTFGLLLFSFYESQMIVICESLERDWGVDWGGTIDLQGRQATTGSGLIELGHVARCHGWVPLILIDRPCRKNYIPTIPTS